MPMISFFRSIGVAGYLLLIVPGIAYAQTESTGCKLYEPASVSLKGRIVRKTFPGPANYEDIRKGDRPETCWLLELESPICVAEDRSSPEVNPAMKEVRTVQLVLREDELRQYRSWPGKRVVAIGTLSGAITGHHHAPLLLTVTGLEHPNWK